MSETAPVIELTDISKTYGRSEGGVRAVRDVSLSVRGGEVYGFLGPNGAGKSTTIRMLLGLISPTGGEVRLFGQKRDEPTCCAGSAAWSTAAISTVPLGRRNLEVLARTHGMERATESGRIDSLLEQVGLAGRRAPQGERLFDRHAPAAGSRRGLAERSRRRDPRRAGQRPRRRRHQEMRFLIRRLAEEDGKAVFLSSHLLHEVQQLCDRVAIITKGAVVHESTIADLLRHDWRLPGRGQPIEVAQSVLSARWACRVEGAQLHVDATREEVPELVKRLVGAGAEIFTIVPAERNLEEVFLSMTQEGPQEAIHA
jgi:ABC-2 type transport system ATP-binding protein